MLAEVLELDRERYQATHVRRSSRRLLLLFGRPHTGTNRKRQQVLEAASVAQFYGNASPQGVIAHELEELLDRHCIRQGAPHPFQPLSERPIEIETSDRSLRASRIPLLPCPAHVVHVPSSLTSSEARRKQTSALRTRQQVLEPGLYFDVRPSDGPTEPQLSVTSTNNSR